MKKRGQMKLSFGMIFSIILIIIFIAFAIYGILKLISFQESVIIEQFKDDLQYDIEKMWKGAQGSQPLEYNLPKKITSVCFVDDEYENLVMNSDKFLGGAQIEHIDIEKTLNGKDSLCVDNKDGKVRMTIKKDFGETLVTIEK